jgi:membrane associated rhomboid family serine protease
MDFLKKIKYNFQQQGVLTQIIVINVAVFLTVNVIGNLSHLSLLEYLALPIGGAAFLYKFWTLFTYMFTHAGLGHIFWNMVTFYFMSQIFFTIMGQKKLLYLYVMSGICGGALVLLLGMLFPASLGHGILIGASAAVMGVGAVMAVYSPNYRVYPFGVFEISYKYFYLIIFVISTIIDLADNTGGKISHMGGALFGVVYGYYLKQGTDLFNLSIGLKRKSKLRVVSNNTSYSESSVSRKSKEEHTMDELLDKISKSGYDSLSKSEKDELFKLSQKK